MTAWLSQHRSSRGARARIVHSGLAAVLVTSIAATGPAAAATKPRPAVQGLPARTAPVARSHSSSHFVVTLVTGDRVAVTRLASGQIGAHLLPGSPSFGAGQQVTAGLGHAYVIPRTLTKAEALNLDTSMFDVLAIHRIARPDGSVPVTVTFARGAAPHPLRGLNVDLRSAHRSASGRVSAPGSYAIHQASAKARHIRSWSGVASVRLAGTRPMAAPPRASGKYELHTLTFKLLGKSGHGVRFGDVVVQNVDDTRLYFAEAFFGRAGVKLSVPEGHYSVIASDFSRATHIAVDAQFSITQDMTLELSTTDSTANVGVSVPGGKLREKDFEYFRKDAKRGSFTYLFGSSPNSPLLVSPVAASAVTVGVLKSEVRAHLTGGPKTTFDTIQGFSGIPADLDRAYPRSAFARQRSTYYSDEPGRKSFRVDFRFLPWDHFDFELGIPFSRPAVRDAYFLGQPNAVWQGFVDVYFTYPPFREGILVEQPRIYHPGQREAANWLKGPIRPGVPTSIRGAGTGRACAACRFGDTMQFRIWGFTDSTPGHYGDYYAGRGPKWTLKSGHRVLATGRYTPFGRIHVPADPATYKLAAAVVPNAKVWTQSTRVHDTWTFHSAHGSGPLPLMFPRYRLPVNLLGRVKHDVMRLRLDLPHLARAAGPKVTSASLRVSYNGGISWHPADLTRIDRDTFKVVIHNVASSKQRYATIQVKATDSAGNAVTEQVNRAYVVRPHQHRLQARPASADRRKHPRVKHACGTPQPRQMRCDALITPGIQHLRLAAEPKGYGPADLQDAYNLPANSTGQTVAVVVAYDYPTAEADVAHYRKQFGLPPCTSASGCFTKLNQKGEEGNYPRRDQGWALEAALDLAMASSACPRCHLVLVEARTSYFRAIAKAVDTAAASGAAVVNNSYGAQEGAYVNSLRHHYEVPGVTMTASSGDFGYQPAQFPAADPAVLSLGGTALHHASNPRGWRENAWSGAGSGCSAYFDKPSYQTDQACHVRTIADISAVAAPATGVAVYDSFGFGHRHGWFVLGGTSVSSPLAAGMVAAASSGGTLDIADLYANPQNFYDITKGSNGFCKHNYICQSKPGYDGPTGIGTPRGLVAF